MGKTIKLGGAEAKWNKGWNVEEVKRSLRGKSKLHLHEKGNKKKLNQRRIGMKLTDGHLEGASGFIKKMVDSKRFGEQPWCVVYNDGEVVIDAEGAVCASGVFQTSYDMKKQPVMFQTYIDNSRADNLNISDELIAKYVNNVVKKSIVSPYIMPHSSDIRMTHGIPIRLFDVPRSAPLITSTHVRAMWDRHNRAQLRGFLSWQEQFPRMAIKKLFLLSNILYGVSFDTNSQSSFSCYSAVHAPFGDEISVVQARNYLLSKDIFYKIAEPVFKGYERGMVDGTFEQRREKGKVRDLVEGLIKELPTYKSGRYPSWKGQDTKTLGKRVLEAILNA
jgi:hypothetical protein